MGYKFRITKYLYINLRSADTFIIHDPNLIITASDDAIAPPNGAGPSAGTMLNAKLDIILFLCSSRFTLAMPYGDIGLGQH